MSKELIEKAIQELGLKGKGLEGAEQILAKLLADAKPAFGKARKDREGEIPVCTDLQVIRKEMKTAYASKSKMKDNAEAVARYTNQITICQHRIAELRQECMKSEDPIAALLAYNEDPSMVLQAFIEMREAELDAALDPTYNKATRKRAANLFPPTTPEALLSEITERMGAKAAEYYEARVRNEDQRVRNLNRQIRLLGADKIDVATRLAAKAAAAKAANA